MTPTLGRGAILARVCQAMLVAGVHFRAAVNLISEQWPVSQPYGWTLLPWVILAVCGVGYAVAVGHQITR